LRDIIKTNIKVTQLNPCRNYRILHTLSNYLNEINKHSSYQSYKEKVYNQNKTVHGKVGRVSFVYIGETSSIYAFLDTT